MEQSLAIIGAKIWQWDAEMKGSFINKNTYIKNGKFISINEDKIEDNKMEPGTRIIK